MHLHILSTKHIYPFLHTIDGPIVLKDFVWRNFGKLNCNKIESTKDRNLWEPKSMKIEGICKLQFLKQTPQLLLGFPGSFVKHRKLML